MQGGDDDGDSDGAADMPRLRRPSQQPSQRRLLKMVTTSLESSEFAHLNLAVQEAEVHRADATAASTAETSAAAAPPGVSASRSSSHGVAFAAAASLEDAPAQPGGLHAGSAVRFISRPHTAQRHQDAGRLHGFVGCAAAGGGQASAASAAEGPAAPMHARKEDVHGMGWETPPLDAAGNSLVVLEDHLDLALVSLGSTGGRKGGNTACGGRSSRGGYGGGVGALTWLGD
ncbi:hypothetical protein HXX76_006641 [Chlamydomonas incerta]|uniref:Uncharacterized protein n=1 Tax=Chlamydomonas incerta TaxID=51695 RepID=A0A835W0R0_CHLIN|nr:hypothetical protein HXX76_006641 [Chlamydomonas incerta]|eukprot:KAG2436332.1 hypothetical protein HXX76_006641 [Chlamydomonas incerta]